MYQSDYKYSFMEKRNNMKLTLLFPMYLLLVLFWGINIFARHKNKLFFCDCQTYRVNRVRRKCRSLNCFAHHELNCQWSHSWEALLLVPVWEAERTAWLLGPKLSVEMWQLQKSPFLYKCKILLQKPLQRNKYGTPQPYFHFPDFNCTWKNTFFLSLFTNIL